MEGKPRGPKRYRNQYYDVNLLGYKHDLKKNCKKIKRNVNTDCIFNNRKELNCVIMLRVVILMDGMFEIYFQIIQGRTRRNRGRRNKIGC